jgi:hypothetical protein
LSKPANLLRGIWGNFRAEVPFEDNASGRIALIDAVSKMRSAFTAKLGISEDVECAQASWIPQIKQFFLKHA